VGSNPTLSANWQFKEKDVDYKLFFEHLGEVSEWLKEHAWKACVVNATAGSNPALSANIEQASIPPQESIRRLFVKMGQ
jgi:hypothetical protein